MTEITFEPFSERPKALTLEGLQRRGLPPALVFLIDDLWRHKVVHWASSLEDEDCVWIENHWQRLANVQRPKDLIGWAAGWRQALWGSPISWDEFAEKRSLAERLECWENARRWLGGPVLARIKDHQRWRQAWDRTETTSVASMVEQTRWRRALRRTQYPDLRPMPAHWTDRLMMERWLDLRQRFGLVSIVASADLTLNEVWQCSCHLEEGLASLARVVDWSEQDVGGFRIGISFEINEDNDPSATCDHQGYIINLGLRGPGSFAHEWAHALDMTLGQVWEPRALGRERFASHQVGPEYTIPPSAARDEHLRWKARADWPQSAGLAALTRRRTMQHLPLSLRCLCDEAPTEACRALGEDAIGRLLEWWRLSIMTHAKREDIREGWSRWQSAVAELWPHDLSVIEQRWREEWNVVVKSVDRVVFGGPTSDWSWRALASARDRLENGHYWSQPHEDLARSFHAFVRAQVGQDSWLADRADRADHFPQGTELEREVQWWKDNLPRWRSVWSWVAASSEAIGVGRGLGRAW